MMGVKQPSSPDSDMHELLLCVLIFVQALHQGNDRYEADHVSIERTAGSRWVMCRTCGSLRARVPRA
jgi:hypothetical protein